MLVVVALQQRRGGCSQIVVHHEKGTESIHVTSNDTCNHYYNT